MGGELTYAWISGNTYELKVTFFRDCNGIPAPSSFNVDISSASCAVNMTTILYPTPGNPTRVSSTCTSVLTTCDGGIYTGIEKWVYTSTVTLPANCPDYSFSASECCRNAAITTIIVPSSIDIFFFATLDNLNTPFNNSPVFSIDPVAFFILGQQNDFNNGAFDPDGDSLVYSLIPPRDDLTTYVTYDSGYTFLQPFICFPPASFNPLTGDFNVVPTQQDVSMIVFQVSEYRNGVLIGTVSRDVQVSVVPDPNFLPLVTGINGTPIRETSICVGDTLRFMVYSTDLNSANTTEISWPQNSNSPFSITRYGGHRDSALVELISDPSMISARPYQLYLSVSDDNCPYIGYTSYSFQVYVNSCSSNIWPGDANSDLKCDIYDILPIGIGYGTAGPMRPNATINWVAETNSNWTNNFVSNVNYKHADCNGDGIIDYNDTTAISQNFGLTHPVRLSNPNLENSVANVSIVASQDSAGPADNLNLEIRLGDLQTPITGVYGIAFQLNFDQQAVDSTQSSFNFVSSNLGTPGMDLLPFVKTDWNSGTIYAAAVRTDHLHTMSDSTIAIFNITITNSIALNTNSIFTLSGPKVIDRLGHTQTLSIVNDTVNINTSSVGTKQIAEALQVKLFPNPAQNELYILSNVSHNGSIMIHDMSGRKVIETNIESPKTKIDIGQLSSGIYSVGIKSNFGLVWKKLIVSR